jgi:hypothetical protein
MNKIKITKGIQQTYEIEEEIKPDTDYLITHRIARTSVEQPDSHGEGVEPKRFIVQAFSIEGLKEVGKHEEIKIDIDQDKWSPSQIQKLAVDGSLLNFTTDIKKDYKIIIGVKSVKIFNLIKELNLNPLEIMDKFISWLESKKI